MKQSKETSSSGTIHRASAKQAQILETGKSLFSKHGTKRVSIEEICREAGVSKMTFYRYYPNKNELIKAVLILMLDESMMAYRELMARDISFKAKMEEIVRLKFESTDSVSEEFAKDIYINGAAEIKALYQELAGKIMQEVIGHYQEAQAQGWIRADIKPGFIMYMMEAMRDQYFDEKLRAMYPNINDLAVELNHFLYYGLGLKE